MVKATSTSVNGFSVVPGGALRPDVRALYLDALELDEREEALVNELTSRGIEVVHPNAMAMPSVRAEDLAAWCHERSLGFKNVAAVALCGVDLSVLLGAGVAFALEDAGRDCCTAADRAFPARADGGLVQALRALVELVDAARSGAC